MAYDLEYFFDPVCPFAWITSRWVTEVRERTGRSVRWRFISLSMVNEGRADLPPFLKEAHGMGRRMLRIAAAVDAADGNDAVSALYTGFGTVLHVEGATNAMFATGTLPEPEALIAAGIARAGFDPALLAAADDESLDDVLREGTETALGRTGPDVGTPILTFAPGTDRESSLFGPVISRAPRGEDAVRLWDAVLTLAATPGFSELKRSLRDPLDFA